MKSLFKKTWMTSVVTAIALALFASAALAQVEITFQYRADDLRTATVEAWIEEFERQNPDIKVNFLPATGDYRATTIVSWAAGTGPDVTEIWGAWAQDYARAGVLMDLRPFVERDFTAADIADFFPTAWQASTLQFGENAGIIYGIPRYMITLAYYYNQDMFERAGIANPNQLEAQGDWTYETLRDIAQKLTIRVGDDVQQWGLTTDTDSPSRLSVWIRAFGGDWFDPQDPTRFTGHEGAAVEAMDFLQQMIWQDGSTAPTYITDDFRGGRVAMAEDGIHAVLSRYDQIIGNSFDWDIAPAVNGPNGRKSYTGDDRFSIWRDTPHPEAAWRFVKFLTSKEGQEINLNIEGLAPVRASAFPAYQQLSDKYNLGVLITNMQDAGAPLNTILPGNPAEIEARLVGVLDSVMELNEKPWVQGAREVADIIESLVAN